MNAGVRRALMAIAIAIGVTYPRAQTRPAAPDGVAMRRDAAGVEALVDKAMALRAAERRGAVATEARRQGFAEAVAALDAWLRTYVEPRYEQDQALARRYTHALFALAVCQTYAAKPVEARASYRRLRAVEIEGVAEDDRAATVTFADARINELTTAIMANRPAETVAALAMLEDQILVTRSAIESTATPSRDRAIGGIVLRGVARTRTDRHALTDRDLQQVQDGNSILHALRLEPQIAAAKRATAAAGALAVFAWRGTLLYVVVGARQPAAAVRVDAYAAALDRMVQYLERAELKPPPLLLYDVLPGVPAAQSSALLRELAPDAGPTRDGSCSTGEPIAVLPNAPGPRIDRGRRLLTHCVIARVLPRSPEWVRAGMAALFDSDQATEPLDDYRLYYLLEDERTKQGTAVAGLLKSTAEDFAGPGGAYLEALARYVLLLIHERMPNGFALRHTFLRSVSADGVLAAFSRRTPGSPPTSEASGLDSLELALNARESLPAIETAFRAFVLNRDVRALEPRFGARRAAIREYMKALR